MGEKSENFRILEDLFSDLKVIDFQEVECVSVSVFNFEDYYFQSYLFQDGEVYFQEDQEEEECFYDINILFEEEELGVDKVENKFDDDVNVFELDEEYLVELEKNMLDEEKQVNILFILLVCYMNCFLK